MRDFLRIAAPVAAAVAFALTAPQSRGLAEPPDDPDHTAREIDRLVETHLEGLGLAPHPIVEDETFCRRAYLVLAGRIPSVAEIETFLADASPDKRGSLVDSLLESPAHVSHMTNFWVDLFRSKTRLARRVSGAPFLHFIEQSVVDNVPYDTFVREMLTAEGAAYARDNGATGYLLRDQGMPADSLANTMRVFVGTRIECAQCHDHPFDRWKQREFYEMVAFFGGLRYEDTALRDSGRAEETQDLLQELRRSDDAKTRAALRRLLRQIQAGLSGNGTGVARLPNDYAYEDARPRELVRAKTLFGDAVDLPEVTPQERPRGARNRRNREVPERLQKRLDANRPQIDSRNAFAEWMTSPSNPRFTKVISNRLWKQVVGQGLIEPVDDIRENTVASDPELMDFLEELMVSLHYDLREYLRILCHTELFQRETYWEGPQTTADFHFQGPLARRLSAEQMWDSLLTLVLDDADATLDSPGVSAESVYSAYAELAAADSEGLRKQLETMRLRAEDPAAFRRMEREKRAEEREETAVARQEHRREAAPLLRALRKARNTGDEARVAEFVSLLKNLGYSPAGRPARSQRNRRGLVRASELPSPAPDGHLLREFGQSDREQIDAAHTEPTVTQVLALLNGLVEDHLLRNRGAAVMKAIDAARTPTTKIRRAYLGILGREPSDSELETCLSDLSAGELTVDDLVWILVNTHEFLFLP